MSNYIKHTEFLNERQYEGYSQWVFWCPGCNEPHPYVVREDKTLHPAWEFNGDVHKPTFTPSLLLNRNKADYEGCGPRCHIFLTDGKIHYLSDCEHELAGQVVDMVPYDQGRQG